MALSQSAPHLKYPSISAQTLDSSVESMKSQYSTGHSAGDFIPQAVYVKQLPSYDEFFAKFLVPNQLCILSESATKEWRSRRDWVYESGSPNFDFLRQKFGNATVPVADCKHKEFSAHAKREMSMADFLIYWQQHRENGHPSGNDSLYLKDWHFTRAFPDYKAYSTASLFRSDWMNEFWDVREDIDDDYRFVYMGPKGTWTPFHADVFRSFSWSANICGQKKWIFFPPGEEEHLKDIHGNLVYDVTSKDLEDVVKYPNAGKAKNRIEILQHPGETIFVPSGWHHQVENLEDTISINHNWLNGCNIRLCWAHLKTSLTDVQEEIKDCCDMEEWDQQCQVILKALTGLDFHEFFLFMQSVAWRRIQALNTWLQDLHNTTTGICTVHQDDIDVREEESIEYPDKVLPVPLHRRGTDVDNCDEFSSKYSQFEAGTVKHEPLLKQNASKIENKAGSGLSCQNRTENENICDGSNHASESDTIYTGIKQLQLCSHSDDCEATVQSSASPSSNGMCSSRNGYKSSLVDIPCHQLEGELLDLSDNLASNRQNRPHWSHCNVYHALFDLASIYRVLKDMMAHKSMVSVFSEVHESSDMNGEQGEGTCGLLQERHGNGLQPEDIKLCCTEGTDLKCSETNEEHNHSFCPIRMLLAEIGCTLSGYCVKGDWQS